MLHVVMLSREVGIRICLLSEVFLQPMGVILLFSLLFQLLSSDLKSLRCFILAVRKLFGSRDAIQSK